MQEHPLKLLRTALKMNQAEFAETIEVSAGRISQVESGNGQRLGGSKALLVAQLYRAEMARLGLTLEDLLRGSRDAA